MKEETKQFKYPGVREAMDGNTAVIMCERESSDGAGAYPNTPSTQMGEYWAEAAAAGHINISDRPLIFIEPEGEHAAAAVTAGLSMTGLRACNFSSGQGIAYMHESLYAAVGKRLTYVLNMGCRAMTKSTLNVHAGHDDYHCVDDAGFFQVFGKSAQEASDLNIIAHKIAELALTPAIVAQDGFLTTHLIESLMLAERALIAEYLGRPDDIIDTPTAAQRMIYGPTRRRIPELWTVDNPVMAGIVQNQDSYMQSVAAQRPYFFDHIAGIADQCFEEFYQLTGRRYNRIATYKMEDAEYVIVGQGSLIGTAEAVTDYLRATRGIKIGVVNMTMFRPFPSDLLTKVLKGRKGVAVLERTDQPLAEDLPLIREVRAAVSKCLENGRAGKGALPYPQHETYTADNAPALYSGAFGLGSRDLQPEGVIAAIENMLPNGKQKKFYYLSIDFVREKAYTPKQEIHQQAIIEGYPHVKELALRGSENPNLMPDGSITVRLHSIGGWGAITTGKNLAMTLFDLLGYHIKANPKYGSEKKGQPTTYYLSAAPEPIRINCEYFYVDCVLSPDPNVLSHSNALAGLKKGGVFIIQSDKDAQATWNAIPAVYQKIIIDNDIKVFFLDAFKIAREEATDLELQFRMQGIAFQGAFFAASGIIQKANLTEEKLFKAIEEQLEHKFGSKGRRVVEDNLRVVRRGFDEIAEITDKTVTAGKAEVARKEADVPIMLKRMPASSAPSTDIHRFWEQTGNFYLTGKGNDNLTDPFIGMSLIPAATGVFRDMTQIRFQHPVWDPDKCTACGNCWTICPDTALPALVNTFQEVFETTIKRLEAQGQTVKHLRKAVRPLETHLRAFIDAGTESDSVAENISRAIKKTLEESKAGDEQAAELKSEFALFEREINEFKFAVSKPFYSVREKKAKGSGGLLSITLNPYGCKACMECVRVCPDNALKVETQTTESTQKLRKNWEYWLELPNTNRDFMNIESLDERIGTLEHMLLDRNSYMALMGGDGACLGCGEKTIMRLFCATVEASMQPRVQKHIEYLDDLIARMEKHMRLKLAEAMDVSDADAISAALNNLKDKELTLSNLTGELDKQKLSKSLDSDWLKRATQMLAKLKHLRWQYVTGVTHGGRSKMGMVNSTGCSSVWGSTYPYNPYPFPWTNHLFQDSTSVAMGLFEGHMSKMAEGFRAIRQAELELEGKYDARKHDEFFRYFNWRQFTDEEWLLCPPVVAVGGDGAMYDIGFQNLSRLLMSGKPVKVMVLDTQVYSNTGGQACTSGFIGQISDMAQFGKAQKGKEEIRKEIALLGMAHRSTYVLQSSISHTSHLIEGFIEGLMARRPALFNVYAPCMPEHGIPDDVAKEQARLAVESRAYPLFTYNPDLGKTPQECFNLEVNTDIEKDWVSYTLRYVDDSGKEQMLELPMTFADFAVTEGRFRKHFKKAPQETWNDDMIPVSEFLELAPEDREGKFPFVWTLDKKNHLGRLVVALPIIQSCEERRDFWTMLRALAGAGQQTVDTAAIATQARQEVIQNIASGLAQLAQGGNLAALAAPAASAAPVVTAQAAPAQAAPAASGNGAAKTGGADGYVAPWMETVECTACGECVAINGNMFKYNDKKQAELVDPNAGSFKDLVKAAERCPSRAIHPGHPGSAAMSEKGMDKLVKRAAKFNE